MRSTRPVLSVQLLAAIVSATLLLSVAACGTPAPSLPQGPAAMSAELSGGQGQAFLDQVSTYHWSDGGAAAANALAWIGSDAQSPNPETAARAGQAAHAIAAYLGKNGDRLLHLPTGWFGLQHRNIGQLNPALVRGYGAASVPYQAAMVGDVTGTAGFTPLPEHAGDFSAPRNVFAVIDTDTEAGKNFTAAAYGRVDNILRAFAEAVTPNGPAADSSRWMFAAYLAGVVEGGAVRSGNRDIHVRNAQESEDYAKYVIVSAMKPVPGQPIPVKYFNANGALLAPEQISGGDLEAYSESLSTYLQGNKQTLAVVMNFQSYFNQGAGTR